MRMALARELGATYFERSTMQSMRRKDRAVKRETAVEFLKRCEWGTLAIIDAQGKPYAVPMNFCLWNEQIYFHCAQSGHKIANIEANRQVCFVAVATAVTLPELLSTHYQSTVVHGTLFHVVDPHEKQQVLLEFLRKFTEFSDDKSREVVNARLDEPEVYCLHPEHITGKERPMPGKE